MGLNVFYFINLLFSPSEEIALDIFFEEFTTKF